MARGSGGDLGGRPLEHGRDRLRGRVADGGSDEQHIPVERAEARDAPGDQPAGLGGHRQRLAGQRPAVQPGQLTPDLEGEQRVAAAGLVETDELRAGQHETEALAHELTQHGEGHRPDLECLVDLADGRAQRVFTGRALGHQQADRQTIVDGAAQREREHACGRAVDPLHVVDREKQLSVSGGTPEHAEHGGADRAGIRRSLAVVVDQQQRQRERPSLRHRQVVEVPGCQRLHEVSQRRIREAGLLLGRPPREDEAAGRVPRRRDRAPPQHRLADPGLPGKRQRPGTRRVLRSHRGDPCQLRRPPEQAARLRGHAPTVGIEPTTFCSGGRRSIP